MLCRWIAPVYAGLHFVPPLLFRRKAWMKRCVLYSLSLSVARECPSAHTDAALGPSPQPVDLPRQVPPRHPPLVLVPRLVRHPLPGPRLPPALHLPLAVGPALDPPARRAQGVVLVRRPVDRPPALHRGEEAQEGARHVCAPEGARERVERAQGKELRAVRARRRGPLDEVRAPSSLPLSLPSPPSFSRSIPRLPLSTSTSAELSLMPDPHPRPQSRPRHGHAELPDVARAPLGPHAQPHLPVCRARRESYLTLVSSSGAFED